MSEMFTIKARHSQEQVEIEVSENTTIEQIKDVIEARLFISVREQRLISQGKVLNDSDTVLKAKLQPGFVLQVMKKDVTTPPPAPATDSERRSDPIFSLQNLLNSLPPALLFDRGSRPRPRRPVPLVFKLESVRQNLITIESLLETRASPWMWSASDELFNYRNRRFQTGQWVDVKDTVDAWLEAQIVDVRKFDESALALVHYNEWPAQWDEWIEVSSTRIQPFRTHSKQTQDSPVQSPFPLVLSPEVFRHHSTLLDVSDYIHQLATIMESLQPLLTMYFRFSDPDMSVESEDLYESDFEQPSDNEEPEIRTTAQTAKLKLGQQLGIVLDRIGRALADISFFVELGASGVLPGQARLAVMPTLSDSRVTDQETEIRIHAIFAPLSQRRH